MGIHMHKNVSRQINVKCKKTKLLLENVREYLGGLGFSKVFLNTKEKAQSRKKN